jgi:hypothetical protein
MNVGSRDHLTDRAMAELGRSVPFHIFPADDLARRNQTLNGPLVPGCRRARDVVMPDGTSW